MNLLLKLFFKLISKTYVDETKFWEYRVARIGKRVLIKCFPGQENDYYLDKSKAHETYAGIISKGGNISIDDPSYEFEMRLVGREFQEMNNEGEWNIYCV